jgi:hypothetical protein
MTFVTECYLHQLEGDLGFKFQYLELVKLDGDKLLADKNRHYMVTRAQAPDGYIYL